MPKKKPMKGKPKVNPELEGLEIKINELGEIEHKYDVDKLNAFLNKNVPDKKLGNEPESDPEDELEDDLLEEEE